MAELEASCSCSQYEEAGSIFWLSRYRRSPDVNITHCTLRLASCAARVLPRTINVRHGDSHFDEVGVFGVVCAGVA